MAQPIQLNIPGYGPPDASCPPCSGVNVRVVNVSPRSLRRDLPHVSQFQAVSLKCASRSMSSVCNASSGSYRRNPDFSRPNRNGFSRNRNRQNEEKDGSDNFEVSELLSSKNGRLPSASGTPKFQATATAGPREKEIVELFRKVQAQLRQRGVIKEQKKTEEPQEKTKQNETVDSLLKLLRKHSVQQRKKSNSSGSNSDFILDQPEPNGSLSAEKSSTFFRANDIENKKVEESEPPPVSRPISNFRRRSPVPQIKKQPVYPDEDISYTNLEGTHVGSDLEHEEDNDEPKLKFKIEPEPELEPEAELESAFTNGHMFDEMSDDETSEVDEGNSDDDADELDDVSDHRDLNEMKVTELRALAKSRGIKGFSKMKKLDLVELLTEASL